MSHDVYPVEIVLGGERRTLLWYEDPTGFANDRVCTRDGRVVTTARHEVPQTVAELGVSLVVDSAEHAIDFDAVDQWVRHGATSDPDQLETLAVWNLVGDLARSIGVSFHDSSAELDALYDKLFAANNLPAVTPVGKHYAPSWSDTERELLRSLLAEGQKIMQRAITTG